MVEGPTREAHVKAFWRPGGDGTFHLFYKAFDRHPLGIRFSTLCNKEWMSTIKYWKPKPYPPTENLCEVCLTSIPKGCKT